LRSTRSNGWSSLQGDDGALGRGADHAAPVAGVAIRVSPVREHGVRVLDDGALECHERRHWHKSTRQSQAEEKIGGYLFHRSTARPDGENLKSGFA